MGFLVDTFLLVLCLTILHELIHGITWGIFAKNHFHSIDFGIIWSSFAPYCTCSEPLKKWQYLLGTAMPTLVLGGGAAVVAVITNQIILFFLAEISFITGLIKKQWYQNDIYAKIEAAIIFGRRKLFPMLLKEAAEKCGSDYLFRRNFDFGVCDWQGMIRIRECGRKRCFQNQRWRLRRTGLKKRS